MILILISFLFASLSCLLLYVPATVYQRIKHEYDIDNARRIIPMPPPSSSYFDGDADYWNAKYALATSEVGDEAWQRERAKRQKAFAISLRGELKDVYPDKLEPSISTLERLYRLAVYAIKDTVLTEEIDWARKWQTWWRSITVPYTFDRRSAPEEFLAYTMDRKSGIIADTEENLDFEYQLIEDFWNSLP